MVVGRVGLQYWPGRGYLQLLDGDSFTEQDIDYQPVGLEATVFLNSANVLAHHGVGAIAADHVSRGQALRFPGLVPEIYMTKLRVLIEADRLPTEIRNDILERGDCIADRGFQGRLVDEVHLCTSGD